MQFARPVPSLRLGRKYLTDKGIYRFACGLTILEAKACD
jgi:hypothetical protein